MPKSFSVLANHQISIRPCLKGAVILATMNTHLIFLGGFCGYVWVNTITLSPLTVKFSGKKIYLSQKGWMFTFFYLQSTLMSLISHVHYDGFSEMSRDRSAPHICINCNGCLYLPHLQCLPHQLFSRAPFHHNDQ